MLGALSPIEIEDLLHEQIVGRIGCYSENRVYVVPISYAYDGQYIYCHTHEGMKVNIMRKNPNVCFQVDEMKDMGNWKSVICWGEFEELKDEEEKHKALLLLIKRPLPVISSETTHLGTTWPFNASCENGLCDISGIVFRIYLEEKTGKCEQTSELHLGMFT
jgi:nitroimidazol reductase NimA-like FMN-containing flavoprotein (pyridoxamine 5'-phosphate oxidase superfamily)